MGLFSSRDESVQYAVILDIGSGSVLASIIESDLSKKHPKIIWSKREFSPLRQVDSLQVSVKNIMTSLVNVLMILDSEGRTKLREVAPKAKISYMQITIAAPWSYTVTKTISYKNDESFVISESFIEELLRMAQQKVLEELKENEKIHKFGLSIISRNTADVVANGYSVRSFNKQKANSVKVIELTSITSENIVNEIDEIKDKVFPDVNLYQYSFMTVFYYAVLDLYKENNEFCLVDVTYEATELGVVREGVLQYCTNIPFGIISLAREVSTILSVSIDEAKSYFVTSDLKLILDKYSDKQKKDVDLVIKAYQKQLGELFKETGDKLSIPKDIFMHSDLSLASFFKQQITTVTESNHVVYNVTNDLLVKNYPDTEKVFLKDGKYDTAMLISAQFFHTRGYHRQFEQL